MMAEKARLFGDAATGRASSRPAPQQAKSSAAVRGFDETCGSGTASSSW